MEQRALTKKIKMKGLELGFAKVGITTADDFTEYEAEIRSRPDYDLWVNTKRGAYLGTGSRPRSFYPDGKSIVCAVYSFADIQFPEELDRHVGRAYLSRSYLPLSDSACGLRVKEFARYLESMGCHIYRGDIDVPNRMACARAGVVSYGKNNFAYTDEDGSFIILYTFLIDKELDYDAPTIECKCPPNCRACMDACPTKAIVAPGRLHPQHCLLYNHVLKGHIPDEIRDSIGSYIHGCDICQKACPRNKKVLTSASRKDMFLEELKTHFDLERILLMDNDYYCDVVNPIMYNYIQDMDLFRRNAAIALGNSGDTSHLSVLRKALQYPSPLVREGVEWAIEKLSALSII